MDDNLIRSTCDMAEFQKWARENDLVPLIPFEPQKTNVIQKYVDIARKRNENHIPLGDICEYCGTSSRTKDNFCGRCGAPMKSIVLGFLFGIPIEADDYPDVVKYLENK